MTASKKNFVAALALLCVVSIASLNSGNAQTSQRPGAQRQFAGARPTAAGASLSGIQRALASYSADMGRMPTAAEGLGALLKPPPGARNWRGPYISSNNFRAALTDPWGNLYRYVVQGTGRQAMHAISSNGPDGIPGTRDDLSVQF